MSTDQPWASAHRLVDAFAAEEPEKEWGPYAKVIADSRYEGGPRLTTFELRFHRLVLAEFNTHRVFSRNSASSRAIPLAKQLARVRDHLAFPVSFPAEKKGMQGGEELGQQDRAKAEAIWLAASREAANAAEVLGEVGVHKSVANRLLEPFMWHTVVVTATGWDNFFAQRCSPLAQPEIRVPAEMMLEAYNHHVPRDLNDDEWHLPYVSSQDLSIIEQNVAGRGLSPREQNEMVWRIGVEVSSARCARTSHMTQDGKRDLNEDMSLYQRLISADPMHVSPLEHPARPAKSNKHLVNIAADFDPPVYVELPKYGNLLGWRQHRFDVESARLYNSFS